MCLDRKWVGTWSSMRQLVPKIQRAWSAGNALAAQAGWAWVTEVAEHKVEVTACWSAGRPQGRLQEFRWPDLA